MSTLRFGQIAVDAACAEALASFYADLLGRALDEGASDFFARIAGDESGPPMIFLKVPEERAGKNRLHLDFFTHDIATEVDRALQLGATHLGEFDEYGTQWTTLGDPEGNVFDIGLAHD